MTANLTKLRNSSIKTTQASVVSVILIILRVPGVTVVWRQVDVRLVAWVVDEVGVGHRISCGPLVLTILVSVSPNPVVAGQAQGPVEHPDHPLPDTFTLVLVPEVGEGEAGPGGAEADVAAPGLAHLPVHHVSVGAGEHGVPAGRHPPLIASEPLLINGVTNVEW